MLDIPINASSVQIKRVKLLDDRCDEHNQSNDDEDVYRLKAKAEDRMPAAVGVT